MSYSNEILKEVREAREGYARLFDFDIAAIVADLQRQNERGDWPVVHLAPRRPAGSEGRLAASQPEPQSAGVGEDGG